MRHEVALVGEHPPSGRTVDHPLQGLCQARLERIAGLPPGSLPEHAYLANLYRRAPRRWRAEEAARRYRRLCEEMPSTVRAVVMLGARVSRAAGLPHRRRVCSGPFMASGDDGRSHYAVLHPSGRCREWTRGGAARHAAQVRDALTYASAERLTDRLDAEGLLGRVPRRWRPELRTWRMGDPLRKGMTLGRAVTTPYVLSREVRLSRWLDDFPRDRRHTLLHETAHCLAYLTDEHSGHSEPFRAWCRRLGIPDRQMAPARGRLYEAICAARKPVSRCTGCGHVHKALRRLPAGREWRCALCGAEVEKL